MKKADVDRRGALAVQVARRLTYPLVGEGTLFRNEAHTRSKLAASMEELMRPRLWTYEGVEYSVIRINSKRLPDGQYVLHIELRDEHGTNKRILLSELMAAQV